MAVEKKQYTWEQRFKELRAFANKHGHCYVPWNYTPTPGLGPWVAQMRYHKRRGTLTKEKFRLLTHFGFTWSVEHPRRTWEEHFRELQAFQKKFGHCRVPKIYPQNPRLGQWVAKMRQQKKHGRLAEERVRLLDGLGFFWSYYIRPTWEQRFKELEAFKKEHGHCNLPWNYPPNPQLGRWVTNMRQRRKRVKPARKKIRLLNALGFIWDVKKAKESLRRQKETTEAKKSVAKRRKYHD